MAVTSPDAVARSLSKGPGGGVFFLFGDEEYLKEETASAVVAAHLDPATRDFNYDQLRASDVEPETLASIVATPPMMAEWRVVVVRDVQAIATQPRLRTVIEELVDRPPTGTPSITTSGSELPRNVDVPRMRRLSCPLGMRTTCTPAKRP